MLLDQRVPHAPRVDRDRALAALVLRYFRSHGPATVDDFVWWSGLTARDARAGIAMNARALESAMSGGRTYWLSAEATSTRSATLPALLLPNYDEYLVGYADRSALIDARLTKRLPKSRNNVIFNHTIVVSGQVVGTWTRTQSARAVHVTLNPFRRLRRDETASLRDAVRRFGEFVEKTVTVTP